MLGWDLGCFLSQAELELLSLGFIKLSLSLACLQHQRLLVGFQLLFFNDLCWKIFNEELGNGCLKHIYLPSLGVFEDDKNLLLCV